jgi:hypothetical protein
MSEKKTHPLFVIDADSPVKWPVIVRIPADGGEFATFQFTGVFKRLSEEEYEAILGAKKVKLPDVEGTQKLDLVEGKLRSEILGENAELFPQLMVGWEDVRSANGSSVEFSAETLRKQITGKNGMHLSIGLWVAISEIRNGARLGN